jgi:hypothetical protein
MFFRNTPHRTTLCRLDPEALRIAAIYILKGAISLLAGVPLDDLLGRGIEGELSADENESTAHDGL